MAPVVRRTLAMRRLVALAALCLASSAAAAEDAPRAPNNEFKVVDTHTAKDTHGTRASKLKATKTEALLKLVVVDKDTGPVRGVVISLTGPDGAKYYTEETDETGYSEVLVPIGKKYDIVYVTLGKPDIAAKATVDDQPNLTMKLTLRFRALAPAAAAGGKPAEPPRFVLEGVEFDTGKATLRKDSHARLDGVVEFLTHKRSARVEISGHTDNVGNPRTNQSLSQKRAEACRDYVVSRGVDAARVQAVGRGDTQPVAPNDTEAGRQKNRRIEAREL